MKILIADDDRLIRFSLKSMLGEILGDHGDVFIEASNGKEMVAVCSEQQPDIAFVDIRMPYFNGLEAIKQCKMISNLTEYVIVSGYSDFEYARQGIRLGINEYLLKPVDEEMLQVVVEKLQSKVQKKIKDTNSYFQLSVMDAFNYYETGNEDSAVIKLPEESGKKLSVFMLCIKSGNRDVDKVMDVQSRILQKVRNLGEDIINRKGYYASVLNGEGVPCVIFYAAESEREYILSRMKKISMLETEIAHYFVWFENKDLKSVCALCEKAENAMYLLAQEKTGTVCKYNELMSRSGEKEKGFLLAVNKLLDSWVEADGGACRDIMNGLWRKYKDKKLTLKLNELSTYCSYITGCTIRNDSVKDFCLSFVEMSDRMYSSVSRINTDIIKQTKEYILTHYMNEISISQIADQFNLTANYLSTVFHQKTGEKFIEYLTKTRIEAAKRLLIQNESASVQDIALLVGYNSARHFSTLFQKQTGMTPSAYRKKSVENRT